jgi:periplasmic divalent cation tolerance protein
MSAFRVAHVTIPTDKAVDFARQLVNNELAACVNIVRGIQSVYRWKGKVKESEESLLIIKTTTKKVETLTKFVRENHPDDVPEIITLNVSEGNPDYLDWIDEVT